MLSGEVGPTWETPPQHQICLDFAARYPEATSFVMEKLLDQDPMIAAYAFKILIRMGVEREEILPAAFDRQEEIGVHIHNRIRSQTLGEFISNFFGACDVKSVQRQDQRTRAWQDGPLRDYKLATEVRPGEDATKTGTD